MIRKNFDDYIKTRFSKEKITAIEKQAKLEKNFLMLGKKRSLKLSIIIWKKIMLVLMTL